MGLELTRSCMIHPASLRMVPSTSQQIHVFFEIFVIFEGEIVRFRKFYLFLDFCEDFRINIVQSVNLSTDFTGFVGHFSFSPSS